jgi:S-adenosylmethionine decarboxylase
MHDLAPDIVRQRILIEGYYTVAVDEDVIREFFAHLTDRLSLRTYDAPVIFAPGGEGRDANEGYDAFVPLIDSGISLYVWTGPRFLSTVAFTCKTFDADAAVDTTREFFAMTEIAHTGF